MIYEFDSRTKAFSVTLAKNVTCMKHMHYMMEMVIVTDGILNMNIQNQTVTVEAGYAVFLPQYTMHAFINQTENICCILEYPPEYNQPFYDFIKNHRTVSPFLKLDDVLYQYLMSIIPVREPLKKNLSLMHAQAILMPLCHAFITGCQFYEETRKYDDNLLCALDFVSRNFHRPITLAGVSTQLGIRPDMLTRKFKEQTGVTFWEYVQNMRVDYAVTLMRRGESITAASFNAGFGSIRSFNRVIHQKTGYTPTEFLRQEAEGEHTLYAPEFTWIDDSDDT